MRWSLILLLAWAVAVTGAEWWEEEIEEQEQAAEVSVPVQAAAGKVLWSKGYVEVVGEAACDMDEALSDAHCYVMARRAAIALAQEKLSETVNGIAIDGEATLHNELLRSSTLRTRTLGLVRGAQVVAEDKVTLQDGSILARVWMRLPLHGEGGLAEPVLEHAVELAAERPVPRFSYAPPASTPETCTGIIVDATGLEAHPAMAPRLLVLEALTAALSVDQVDLVRAQEIGIVEYAASVEDARSLTERIGDSPLVLKAVAAQGATKADLVISAVDGSRLSESDPGGELANACKVVFAGDPFI